MNVQASRSVQKEYLSTQMLECTATDGDLWGLVKDTETDNRKAHMEMAANGFIVSDGLDMII